MVIWCICCASALMVFVEQPDTITHDYLDFSRHPHVSVYNFRTSQYGDPDKFVRLTTRNLRLPQPIAPVRRLPEPGRSQHNYANADERDRARSTWAAHPRTCTALAGADIIEPGALVTLDLMALMVTRMICPLRIAMSSWSGKHHQAQ